MATLTTRDRTRNLAGAQRRVRHPLTRLRRYIRLYVTLEGILLVLLFLAAWFWIGLALDYGIFELTRTSVYFSIFHDEPIDWVAITPIWLRYGGLGLLVGAAVIVAAVTIVFRIFRDFREGPLALVLERRYPELLGDRLITAIELANVREVTKLGYSKEMVEATILEASERIKKVPIRKVFNWNRLLGRFVLVLLLGAGLYGLLGGAAICADVAQGKPASTAGFTWVNDVSETWAERNLMVRDKLWPRHAFVELVDFPESGDLRIPKKGAPPQLRVRAWKWVVAADTPEGWRQLRWSDLRSPDLLGSALPPVPTYFAESGDPNKKDPTIDAVELQLAKLEKLEQVQRVVEQLDKLVQPPDQKPLWALAAATTTAPALASPAAFLLQFQDARLYQEAYAQSHVPNVRFAPTGRIDSELPHRWLIFDDKLQRNRPLTWTDLKPLAAHFSERTGEKVSLPELPSGWSAEVDAVEDQVRRMKLNEELVPLTRRVIQPLEELHASGRLKDRLRKLTIPDTVLVISRGATTWNETPLTRQADNEYSGTLSNISENVRFKVKGEDFFTPPRTITLVPKPRLVGLRSNEYQPAYLYFRVPDGQGAADIKDLKQLLADREVSLMSGDTARVEVPAGTDLVLVATSDKPLKKGSIRIPPPDGKTQPEVAAEITQDERQPTVFRATFKNVQRTLDFSFEMTDTDNVTGLQAVLIKPTADRPPTVDVKVYQRPEDQVEVIRKIKDGPYIVSAKAYLPFAGFRAGVSDDHGLETVDYVYTQTAISAGGGDTRFLQLISPLFDAAGGLDRKLLSAVQMKDFLDETRASARDEKNLRRQPVLGFYKKKRELAPLERWTLEDMKTALDRDPSAWGGPKPHPATLPDGMLREYKLDPTQDPDKVAEHDFFDLRPLRLPGVDENSGAGWTKLEIGVEATDTDVVTGPHKTSTRQTYTFMVVSEHELIAEVHKEEEEQYAKLEAALDSLREARSRLDTWVSNLSSGSVSDRETLLLTAGVELQKIEDKVHGGELDARKISRDFQRILLELTYNRVNDDTIKQVRTTVAAPLLESFEEGNKEKEWTFPAQRVYLRALRAPLDKETLKAVEGNAQAAQNLIDKTLDGVRTARANLEELLRRLTLVRDALQGITNDQKLIASLVKIEEDRRKLYESIAELHRKALEEAIGDLFKDKPKDPKKP